MNRTVLSLADAMIGSVDTTESGQPDPRPAFVLLDPSDPEAAAAALRAIAEQQEAEERAGEVPGVTEGEGEIRKRHSGDEGGHTAE